jgi:hypothetical protein
MLVLWSLACAPRAPAPTASAPPVAAAEVERLTLTLDPDDLTYDDPGGVVRFTPGSRVKSAEYTTYVLDLMSLEGLLGGRPSTPVAVVVEVGPPVAQTVVPEDPTLPSPLGGFRFTTRSGKVVALAP